MRVSTVVLPIYPWREGRDVWRAADDLGFHAAYTYDHLSWRTFRDGPWFGAVPTLAAAAGVTERVRLGTLVSSPNFREPVTFAKDVMTLDDLSGGRVTVGLGAGTTGFDATVLGGEPWSARERADRLRDFTVLLDRLLTEPAVTHDEGHYRAHEARTIPGPVQSPRVPFAIAATGPRGLRLAARYGQAWVTTGDGRLGDDATPAESRAAVCDQVDRLEAACSDAGRDPASVERILLTGFTPDPALESVDAFVETVHGYAGVGITEIVVHWPVPGTQFAADRSVFEQIATDGAAQVRGL
ncbi:LLM class flavin-dependent oxidoreductase [Cellulosimicrobium cellulans]|uniref:LLM class flavin-dependent oxidoreductase n=1 Tax=Cellulosimicrobium cellulans TaxID=1710 RepID=UPI001965ACE7|nr:LLM class flavin-dependent oxidoreductase [Cellulosimicrobium cellulans]MBN0041707.1 LLM class flavin-dependent oxidoreductase [Cellulosimicrobium cellulans]